MIETIPILVILLFSVVVHEYAHARVALWKGDTTARDLGRITLNPLPHIDPFGTILLPLMLFLMRAPVLFGRAKPVPVNPFRLRNPKKDMLLVSLAGPISNILLAVISGVVLRILIAFGFSGAVVIVLNQGIILNLYLAFFNLIPIPPLDGSEIIMYSLPEHMAHRYARIGQFGFIIVLLLFIVGPLRFVLHFFVSLFYSIIMG